MKLVKRIWKYTWFATVFLAIAGSANAALPPPLDTLSKLASALFEILLTPVVFVPLFIGMWLYICTTLAKESGWTDLAAEYAVKETGEDVGSIKTKSISGYANDVSFSRSYRVGADEERIVLASVLPFRPGHPTMSLPWSVVSITEEEKPEPTGFLSRLFSSEYITLRVATHPSFEMHILKSDFKRTRIDEFAPNYHASHPRAGGDPEH